MEIKVGDYEVYKTGSVISLPDDPIMFNFGTLHFKVIFENHHDENKQNVDIEIASDNSKMTLRFINFNNSLGAGNVKPLSLAYIGKKELLLNYRVYALGKAGKLFHYTWLLGYNEKNDKK